MRVRLVAGAGSEYGTGHIRRMEELARLLFLAAVDFEFLVIADPRTSPVLQYRILDPEDRESFKQNGECLWIIDARDLDLAPFIQSGTVLALDNRCKDRSVLADSVQFIDTIPHPLANLDETLKMALIPEDVRNLAGRVSPDHKIFSYTGGWADVEEIDRWLSHAVESGSVESAFRCGKAPLSTVHSPVNRVERLPREEFILYLSHSRILLTYFGMTMLEGWYLGNIPVLFLPGSDVHGELTLDLHRRAGIPLLMKSGRSLSVYPENALKNGFRLPSELRPTGEGYDRLMEMIFRTID